MAVTKQAYVTDASNWTVASVCNNLRDAFIGGGLMTAWYDSFTAVGYEHRVLEVVYDSTKTYGKTYYHFQLNGAQIYVRTSTGWNATSHIPCGAGGTAGTQGIDFYRTDLSDLSYAFTPIPLNATVSFSITRYTSTGSRNFFTMRTGSTYHVFTIDPAGTTFKSFYNLNLGYHSGYYLPYTDSGRIRIQQAYRTRRDLLVGSSLNTATYNQNVSVTTMIYSLPRNYGSYGAPIFPAEGFLLPGWTTDANPAVGSNFNPIFTGLRLTSIHASDLPADFGISNIKTSDNVFIQDNATVTANVEEYEILNFSNNGFYGSVTSNAVFLARIV